MKNFNISYLEIAPTKIVPWTKLKNELSNIKNLFDNFNITPYSFQSLFYDTDCIDLCDESKIINHLLTLINYASILGIKVLVLGSPKLRQTIQPNHLKKIFDKLDEILFNKDIYLCIEPNAKLYGGKYFFTTEEIVGTIKNYSNIKTMIDTHNSLLSDQDPLMELEKYFEYIYHIHISEIGLTPIKDNKLHRNFAKLVRELQYYRVLTYEMTEHSDFQKNLSIFREIYQ
jgi:sugar phosphate isomerase/epimerase